MADKKQFLNGFELKGCWKAIAGGGEGAGKKASYYNRYRMENKGKRVSKDGEAMDLCTIAPSRSRKIVIN